MTASVDHTNLHRTAKYFMDNGRAESHEDAMKLLQQFGLTIHVGPEVAWSADHQTALLTLVNLTRRTLLGGIEVVGLPLDASCISRLAPKRHLGEAVRELGGNLVTSARANWPCAVIGSVSCVDIAKISWRLTWEGWRGGVVPTPGKRQLSEQGTIGLVPALAAATCAAEVFAFHAGDHPFAGRRPLGLSLWQPGIDWLEQDTTEPALAFLPSRLWLIGLGNLGQAFAWLLATLPYGDQADMHLVLQDFDRIAASNDSTSLLSFKKDIGYRKARVVAGWLEDRGFEAFIEERSFGKSTRRSGDEPGVALCGVDNALARASLDDAGFDLVVEVGLGAGPQAFRSIAMHTFPSSRRAEDIWSKTGDDSTVPRLEDLPAYQKLKRAGMDKCGLTQLASRTVGVPFVGLIAACLAIAELLRRLNGGAALEFATGSVAALDDLETGSMEVGTYSFGHLPVRSCSLPVAP